MTLEPVLIADAWQQSTDPAGSFTAFNPATKTALPAAYPVSGLAEVELAMRAAQQAVTALRNHTPEDIARFLELYAAKIEAHAQKQGIGHIAFALQLAEGE